MTPDRWVVEATLDNHETFTSEPLTKAEAELRLTDVKQQLTESSPSLFIRLAGTVYVRGDRVTALAIIRPYRADENEDLA